MAKKSFTNFNNARDVGIVNRRKNLKGSITRSDRVDFFELELTGRASFSLSPRRIRSNLKVRLFDGDRDRIGRTRFKQGKRRQSLDRDLAAGTYYVQVRGRTRRNRDRYKLRARVSLLPDPVTPVVPIVPTPPTTPNQPVTPSPSTDDLLPGRDIGVLTGTRSFSDVIGTDDDRDHYKFRLNQIGTFTAQLSGLSQSVGLNLFYDTNKNGIFEDSEFYISDFGSSTGDALLTDTLPVGDYAIRVDNGFNSTNTTYNLRLTHSPRPGNLASDPGNLPTDAFNVGTLSGKREFTDLVGRLDDKDYYKFSLNQISNVSAQITGLSQGIRLEVYYDSNGNGIFEEREFVSDSGSASSNIFLADVLPTGDYLVLVDNTSFSRTNTRYELTLNETPNPGNLATDPGDTAGTAFGLGTITGNKSVVDLVGTLDDLDYYSFSFAQNTDATFQLTKLSRRVSLDVFYDSDNNGIFTSGERIVNSSNSDDDKVYTDTWLAGNYLAVIDHGQLFSGHTKYEFNILLS